MIRETKAVRPLIGVVLGGERGVYWRLTGRENLEYWAALYKVPARKTNQRVSELLQVVGLADWADHLVEGYSRGMKQRLHLARGLVEDASVLFLDEPTTGMDPVASLEFRDLVADLRSQGKTILLTTHDMAEAEVVCDRLTLIDRGKVLAMETPSSLGKLVANYERIDFQGCTVKLLGTLKAIPGVASVNPLPEDLHRVELDSGTAARQVLRVLVDAGIASINTSRPSLEEVYLRVIGDGKDEA